MRDRQREGYDVIVVGGGHAGIEAALAAKRLECTVLMITPRIQRIGEMSCNPAIGGIAKGTIVREVDALDGSMGRAADATCLQFRMLNRRKGPAVWGPRVQSDADAYARYQQRTLSRCDIELLEDEVVALAGPTERVTGVITGVSGEVSAKAVVLATGTFLKGRLFRGEQVWRGGRIGDISSEGLEKDLRERMFHVERFKTGTPSRVVSSSVDLEELEVEESEECGFRFSLIRERNPLKKELFYATYTNLRTHETARSYLHRSPLLKGRIEGTGPRYCPSFEDKVVKFPDRHRHRIYVEPMGSGSEYLYINGLSSSLPQEAQLKMLRTLPGFKEARVAMFGYAVEYSYINHSEIDSTLALVRSENLYAAGQICGTSGYEEAAGLGLLAGTNAARTACGCSRKTLSRMESYIGVMVDDIVRKGVEEPYRMFSSRAENRLHLRQDNADRRLFSRGVELGVIGAARRRLMRDRLEKQEDFAEQIGSGRHEGTGLATWCRRKDFTAEKLAAQLSGVADDDMDLIGSMLLDEKYRGYIQRTLRRESSRDTVRGIGLSGIDSYMDIEEICWEAREKLESNRPATLGEAEEIPGIRPTDIQGLLIHLGRKRSTWNSSVKDDEE